MNKNKSAKMWETIKKLVGEKSINTNKPLRIVYAENTKNQNLIIIFQTARKQLL